MLYGLFVFKDSFNMASHVGIVYKVDKQYIYTIEGNTSITNGLIPNGGAVCKKQYLISYNRIMGYGRPNYIILQQETWQKEFFDKLVSKGYIQMPEIWKDYEGIVSKALCVALLDKITGGTQWITTEETTHWAQIHIMSLHNKKIIEDIQEWWYSLDEPLIKSFALALIDKSTGGMRDTYKNITYDHWARAHLDSLCDKKIISTPEVWCDNFEGEVNKGLLMALLCKAHTI